MAWHEEFDQHKIEAYYANKESFSRFNPDVEIVSVMNPFKDPKQAWFGTDVSLLSWYLANKTKYSAKRYLLIEWDCWCNCNIMDYYSRVLDCDLVVPNVKYPEKDDWYWFRTVNELPEYSRQFATGITPMCGVLISQRVIDKIASEVVKAEYATLNSELRLGTIATMLNVHPIVNPVNNRSLGWRTGFPPKSGQIGIHHPRKTL